MIFIARFGNDLHHVDNEFLVVVLDLRLALLSIEFAFSRVDLDDVRFVTNIHSGFDLREALAVQGVDPVIPPTGFSVLSSHGGYVN